MHETRASRFEAAVLDTYDHLSPADLLWLDETVATIETVDTLRAALADQPLTVTGQGGPRVHPLRVELRLVQQSLVSLLRRFPDVGDLDEEDDRR